MACRAVNRAERDSLGLTIAAPVVAIARTSYAANEPTLELRHIVMDVNATRPDGQAYQLALAHELPVKSPDIHARWCNSSPRAAWCSPRWRHGSSQLSVTNRLVCRPCAKLQNQVRDPGANDLTVPTSTWTQVRNPATVNGCVNDG
jgi:hypothetical protein